MSEEQLLVERDGHVLTVTMNRPEARNAFGLEMLAKMADAWALCDEDPELRVAILTGAGGTFCSGADLKLMHSDQSGNPYHARFKEDPELHWKALLRNARPAVPVIAAVEGIAFGGGTEILQGTDLRVAGESAKFAVSEVRWGLFPLGGSTVRLRRQIGQARAMEMLLTGRAVGAEEAERWGLINAVVADGEALTKARQLADAIAQNGPLAVQAIKRSAWQSDGLSEKEALANELTIGQPIFATDDAREGPKAFAAKRAPVFQAK